MILHFFEGLKRFKLFDVKIPCFILLPFDIIILTDDFITEIKEYENIFFIIICKICKIGLRKKEYTIDLMKISRKLTLTWISKNQICLDTIRIEIVFLWWTMRCRCTLWKRKLDVLGFHICLMSIQQFGLKLLPWYFLWEVLSCLDVFWCRRKQ